MALTAVLAVGCAEGPPEATPPPAGPIEASFDVEVVTEMTSVTSCPVREIRFTDTSTGDPTSWSWTFPDGSTSTERSPTLTAGAPGLRSGAVQLVASDGPRRDDAARSVALVSC